MSARIIDSGRAERRAAVAALIAALETQTEKRPSGLTEREWQVARGLASDKTIKEIASELQVSPKTVEYHWARLKQKSGVRSYVGLVRWMAERQCLPGAGAPVDAGGAGGEKFQYAGA